MAIRIWIAIPLIQLFIVPLALAVVETRIFINTVSGYDDLATCAEYPLSTIVRDMSAGCGDDQLTTSYSCFCTQSSAKMSSIISRHVMSSCDNVTAQATSALSVFSDYCTIGVQGNLVTITDTFTGASGTASPAATSTVASQTGASNSSSSSSSRTTAIAAGVCVPVGVIALVVGALFLFRRRRQSRRQRANARQQPSTELEGATMQEAPPGRYFHEASADQTYHELDSSTKAELEAHGGGAAPEKDGYVAATPSERGLSPLEHPAPHRSSSF